MRLLDKVLFLMLLVLLPIGVLIAYLVSRDPALDDSSDPDRIARVEQLLEQIAAQEPVQNQQVADAPTGEKPEIRIETIQYSSASALLRISGQTTDTENAIFILTAVFPSTQAQQTVVDEGSIGQFASSESVLPKGNGTFRYETLIEDAGGVLRVQVFQDGSGDARGYDFDSRKLL